MARTNTLNTTERPIDYYTKILRQYNMEAYLDEPLAAQLAELGLTGCAAANFVNDYRGLSKRVLPANPERN